MSLNLHFCSSLENIIKKNEIIFKEDSETVLWISPDPIRADNIRYVFQEKFKQGIQSITIATYLRQQIARDFPYDGIIAKKDLLLELSILWNAIFPDRSYDEFFKLFNIFTDLRGKVSSQILWQEVCENFDQADRIILNVFWEHVENGSICDEHRAIKELSKKNIKQEEKYGHICFWGFSQISAVQMDWIKNLSEVCDVWFFFFNIRYDELPPKSWPIWLSVFSRVIQDDYVNDVKGQVFAINRGELGSIIGSNYKHHSCYVADDDVKTNFLQELISSETGFKVQVDLVKEELLYLVNEIERCFVFGAHPNLAEEIICYLNGFIKSSLSTEGKNFKMVKAAGIIVDVIKRYQILSVKKQDINYFFWRTIKEYVFLSTPRSYFVSLGGGISNNSLKRVSGYKEIIGSWQVPSVLCAMMEYPGVSSRYQSIDYPESVLKVLQTIAPADNGALDELMFFGFVDFFLSDINHVLLLDKRLLEKSFAWIGFIEKKKIDIVVAGGCGINSKNKKANYLDLLVKESSKINLSATLLQSYIDCPRQCFMSYFSGLKVDIFTSTLMLNAAELGRVEHEAVAAMFRLSEYDFNESIVGDCLNNFLKKEGKKLSEGEYQKALSSIIVHSRNGFLYLRQLLTLFPGTCYFEYLISDDSISGRIDCLIFFNDGEVGVLDFKRSKGQIPQISEFFNMEKIQLLFYLNHLPKEFKTRKLKVAGYLSLKDTSDSLIFSDDSCIFGSRQMPEIAFFDRYDIFEKECWSCLKKDHQFLCNPRKEKICDHCRWSFLCSSKR